MTHYPPLPKIAFLLDFDGPLFNTELVESEIISFLNISNEEWKNAYREASVGSSFVDIGEVISILANTIYPKEAQLLEDFVWAHLSDVMTLDKFCPKENKEALLLLSQIGRIELVTQGHIGFQQKKLFASNIRKMLVEENKKNPTQKQLHTVSIIAEDKTHHLRSRLKGLVEDGYKVIQIDDRIGPLSRVRDYAEEQYIIEELYQYRVLAGKYKTDKNYSNPNWKDLNSIMEVAVDIPRNLYPTFFKERSFATMRR